MKLKPTGNRILVEKITKKNQSKSGLILHAEEDRNSGVRGKVIAVSDKVKDIRVGETVVFNEVGVEWGNYIVLPTKYVIAVES